MTENVIPINDQPISASFFGQAKWLTEFVTPSAMEVNGLHSKLTEGIRDPQERILACWRWVASEVRYVPFIRGRVYIADQVSIENDLWIEPSQTIKVLRGNCAVKSFLLTSLLRNELSAEQVYCTLGNLYNGKPGGHAWLTLKLDKEYVMESTMPTAPPLVQSEAATRYEPVHYFNDEHIFAVQGKTQLIPYTACYSEWLSSYLHWAYIDKQGR